MSTEPTPATEVTEPDHPSDPVQAFFARAIEVEQTFTPTHVFKLRDELARRVLTHGGNLAFDTAQEIAEGLLEDELANLPALNRRMHTTEGEPTPTVVTQAISAEEPCTRPQCGYKYPHNHGPACGHLCPCGKGS